MSSDVSARCLTLWLLPLLLLTLGPASSYTAVEEEKATAGTNDVTNDVIYHDYCVIGAGPAGLQLGYFMKMAGRDYVVFERSNTSGNFYTTYPRHRKLISINKRHTGQGR